MAADTENYAERNFFLVGHCTVQYLGLGVPQKYLQSLGVSLVIIAKIHQKCDFCESLLSQRPFRINDVQFEIKFYNHFTKNICD